MSAAVITPALKKSIEQNVRTALREDNYQQDLSSAGLQDRRGGAVVSSRHAGVVAGCGWFDEVYRQIDRRVHVDWRCSDGQAIQCGDKLCVVSGPMPSLLQGERCALNFLQLLSGVASQTALYVARAGRHVIIKDTRKTIPGLRQAQKYAVRCGGGHNHRFSLADAILIKENNIAAYGSIQQAIAVLRQHHPDKSIEIEVENMQQVHEALRASVDTILLDNFSIEDAQAAIKIIGRQAAVEISGGIGLDQVKDYAALAVNCLSIGALTKNAVSLDLSMRIEETL